MDGEHLTYEELERLSNRLARLLIERGVEPGERVCLLQPKAPLAIVSMLATLKAGGVYVPLDIASPAARVQQILDSAEPRVVLATQEAAKLAAELNIEGELGCVQGELPEADFGSAGGSRPRRQRACRQGRPCRRGAHPVHLGLDGRAQGRRDHARDGERLPGLGAALFRPQAGRSHLRPSAASLRSLDLRHLRNALERRRASPGAAEGAAAGAAGELHPRVAS